MVKPSGVKEQRLGKATKIAHLAREQTMAQNFSSNRATRLAGLYNLKPKFTQTRCEQFLLRGFACPLPTLKGDENTLMLDLRWVIRFVSRSYRGDGSPIIAVWHFSLRRKKSIRNFWQFDHC